MDPLSGPVHGALWTGSMDPMDRVHGPYGPGALSYPTKYFTFLVPIIIVSILRICSLP